MVSKADITRNHERDDEVAEGAVAFTLTKPVDPAALDKELSEAMNWRKDAGFVIDGDASEASTENPVDLWVLREDVTAATLRSVVGKHRVPERGGNGVLAGLRDKAEAGEEFTPEEVQAVLREFVLRQAGGPR